MAYDVTAKMYRYDKVIGRLAIVAGLCFAAGCGGGGGGHSRKRFAGTYSGPFAVSLRGTMPPGFNPPQSGTASATVDDANELTVDFGSSYLLTAKLSSSGAASQGEIAYPSLGGTQTLPAFVGWGIDDGQRKVSALVTFETPSGRAVFSALLTRVP